MANAPALSTTQSSLDRHEQLHRLMNPIFAGFVFAAAAVVYVLTMAPTVAFWDCGEFLSASASLGIPHPPGTPFLIMIGRIFHMVLRFIPDAGVRSNLIAVLGSATTAMLIYLIVVRTLVMLFGAPDTAWKRAVLYCGGLVGGLFCAFSNTMWFCSLEGSEQCNFCLIPVALSVWLTLMWAQSKSPTRDRLLLLVSYVGFTGIGMHMISMITMPVIFLFVMLTDEAKRKDWRLWLSGLCLSSIMFNLSYFMIVNFIIVGITTIMMLIPGLHRNQWRFCFWFAVLAMIGFSNHLYMPIRSSLNPIIDENHPTTWKAFSEALDRKQYGSESMITRSLWRRGTLGRQFGFEGNMGSGGFHLTQYFHFGNSVSEATQEKSLFAGGAGIGALHLILYLLPTFLMFFGWYVVTRRKKNVAAMLILATLLTTVVMTWYMNFADGTKPERQDYQAWVHAGKPGQMPVVHREVRVRDYFWNAGFMFYAMWVGISVGCLLFLAFTNKRPFVRTTLAPVLLVLFFVSPALPLTQNYGERSRHNNFIPYDFAYNLLMSCEKNAILITNGDNDTFPLWALQEAYGIRRDVRIVNLSLLNTLWYIKQLKTVEPKVPITFSDAEIDQLNAEYNPFTKPTPVSLPDAKITVTIPGRQQLTALRIQDKMVLNIADANHWTKPLYFSTTVSEDNFMGLDPYLQMQGLAYRVQRSPVSADQHLDIDKTIYLFDHVFRFNGLGPTTRIPDETARSMIANYASCLVQIAYFYKKPLEEERDSIALLGSQLAGAAKKDTVKTALLASMKSTYAQRLKLVITELDKGVYIEPWDWRLRAFRQEFLIEHHQNADVLQHAREALASDSTNPMYQQMLGQALLVNGKRADAEQVLRRFMAQSRDPWYACATLAETFESAGLYDSAIGLLEEYQASHLTDQRPSQYIARMRSLKTGHGAGDSSAG